MRTIKLISTSVLFLGCLLSCQIQEIEGIDAEEAFVPITLNAAFEINDTKVTYTETAEYDLRPAWEIGDEIIGFDGDNNNYYFTVSEISADGIATLKGSAPADCTLHLIYLCGTDVSSNSNGSVTVDYTDQAGDESMPAVMLADGVVSGGSGSFTFHNAGSVIGISAVNGVPQGSNVTKITIEGANLSVATVSLDGSTLKLTAANIADDAISVDGLDLTVNDTNGTLSSPVFIAIPADAKIAKVSVTVPKESEAMKIPSTAADKEGVDYVTIAGIKWAKWNIGSSSETDYGLYFSWGDTKGYIWYEDTWQSATSTEFSYSPESAYTVEASDYVYVKAQTFAKTAHSFDWVHAPFNNGGSSYDDTYFSSVRNTVCPGDILVQEYDAAHVNWGGTWRMPAPAELETLYNTCNNGTYHNGAIDGSTYASTACGATTSFAKGIYWCGNYDGVAGVIFCDGTNKLFIPAAGSGYGYELRYQDSSSGICYWSNALHSELFCACTLYLMYNYIYYGTSITTRFIGCQVRPVSD